MPNIVIYLTAYCPYCIRARALLDRKGVQYTVVDVGGDKALRSEMEARSRRQSVPQIFIEGFHVGGYDDMAALDREGKLDALLGLD